MPNPLAQVKAEADLTLGPAGVANSAAIASKFVLIVGTWSLLENSVGLLLAKLLGTAPKVGVATYRSVSGFRARQNFLENVARAALSTTPSELEILLAILALMRSVAGHRNRLVHDLGHLQQRCPTVCC